MLFKFIPATVATLSFLSSVSAWETLCHHTVASVAMKFILQQTLNSVSSILFDDKHKTTENPTLVDVANWAEEYRDTMAGYWSEPLHYVGANDNPPTSGGVDFARDCGAGGCIIAAIQNYTERVQDDSLDAEQRAEALKYLVNLFGDITQPLNAGPFPAYGWDIGVLWDGTVRNLHGVWALLMPLRLAGNDHIEMDDHLSVEVWTEKIVNEILSGTYSDLAPSWLCTDIKQAQTCAKAWASDANALVYSYVLNPSPAGNELNGTYYDGAAPIIEMQIAKGGLRLAAWLNAIFSPGS